MADPFYEPLPTLGQVPWDLSGALQEIRERIAGLDDQVSDSALMAAIAEAAAVLNPTALSDEFIKNQVESNSSFTDGALKAKYPVFRVWNGTSYPARIAGALNIFFGPSDPGVALGAGDYWANPNLTTNDAVATAIQNATSSIYSSLQALNRNGVDIPLQMLTTGRVFAEEPGGSVAGWLAPQSAFTKMAGGVTVPLGWTTARVRLYYFVPTTAAVGDMRVSRGAGLYSPAQSVTTVASVTNTVPAASLVSNRANNVLITGDIDVTNVQRANINVSRVGNSELDTLLSDVYILGARLERVA